MFTSWSLIPLSFVTLVVFRITPSVDSCRDSAAVAGHSHISSLIDMPLEGIRHLCPDSVKHLVLKASDGYFLQRVSQTYQKTRAEYGPQLATKKWDPKNAKSKQRKKTTKYNESDLKAELLGVSRSKLLITSPCQLDQLGSKRAKPPGPCKGGFFPLAGPRF